MGALLTLMLMTMLVSGPGMAAAKVRLSAESMIVTGAVNCMVIDAVSRGGR